MQQSGSIAVHHASIVGVTYREAQVTAVELGGIGRPPPTWLGRWAGRAVRAAAWPAALFLIALAFRVQLAGILPLALVLIAILPGALCGLFALGDRVERPPARCCLRPFTLALGQGGLTVRFGGIDEELCVPSGACLTARSVDGGEWVLEGESGVTLLEGLPEDAAARVVAEVEAQQARLSRLPCV